MAAKIASVASEHARHWRDGVRKQRATCHVHDGFPSPVTPKDGQTLRSKQSNGPAKAAAAGRPIRPGLAQRVPPREGARLAPYFDSMPLKSIPASCRNPRNSSSSSAWPCVTVSSCSTGKRPLQDGIRVGGRIVRIGPALRAVKRMRARAKPEIGFAPPIFQVVARFETRQAPNSKSRSARSPRRQVRRQPCS